MYQYVATEMPVQIALTPAIVEYVIGAILLILIGTLAVRFLLFTTVKQDSTGGRLIQAVLLGASLGTLPVILFMGWMDIFHNIRASEWGTLICMIGVVLVVFYHSWKPYADMLIDGLTEEDE